MRRNKLFIISLTLALLAGPIPAHSAGVTQPRLPSRVDTSPHRVTLITGDIVTFFADNTFAVEAAPRPDGRDVTFTGLTGSTIAGSRDLYVIPSDVDDDTRLDRELFNVTGLVREGLDQATTLPVLIKQANGYDGVRVDGKRKGEFLRGLAQQTKVWLDHRRKVALDVSVPQIGAPAAWGAGLDGTGITVAVIDTGIDATHPDLSDRVVAEHNFTEDPDAADLYGHGTHVASTIAGSGAASGGRYKGVAPGAKLINAKACDGSGSCYDSWLIDAMNYAAWSGAKVINMSVGGGISDGTDPLSLELNRLTAETGALFVVAAGNTGEFGPVTVGSPGAAQAALTVGAVDRDDKLANFSSRGPRYLDAGLKPDLTAPGVSIVAARAVDTAMGTPVGDSYTSASGTSMATPHVAGASAILAQQHPQWTPQRLKDTLVSTAADVNIKVTEGGSGRTDISRAYSAKLTAPAAVDFGRLKRQSLKLKKLTYHNNSDRSVTVSLALTGTGWNGRPIPAGATALTGRITVPARGQADAFLIVNTFFGPNGSYSGVITATADGVSLRTPVSFYVVAPTHTLTTRGLDHHGQQATPGVYVMRDDFDPAANNDPFAQLFYDAEQTADGTFTAEVATGSYSVLSALAQRPAAGRLRWTALSKVDIPVSRKTGVTLDARLAVPLRTDAGDAEARVHSVSFSRSVPGGAAAVLGCACAIGDAYATPTRAPRFGKLNLQDTWTFTERTTWFTAAGHELRGIHDPALWAAGLPGQSTHPAVWAGDGSDFTGIDVAGKVALVGLPAEDTSLAAYYAARNAHTAGAKAIVTFVDTEGAAPVPTSYRDLAYLGLSRADGLAVKTAGTLGVTTKPNPAFVYNLHYGPDSGIPSDLTHRVDPAKLTRVDAEYHADLPGLASWRAFIGFRNDAAGTIVMPAINLNGPAKITEYVGGSADAMQKVTWTRIAVIHDKGRNQITMYNRRPMGGTDVWFSGPSSPGGFDPHNRSFFRLNLPGQEQFLRPSTYMGDGSVGHLLDVDSHGYRATTYRLFRDGTEIPPIGSPYSSVPDFPVPAEEFEYRLEAKTVLPASGPGGPVQAIRRLSARVDTTWTFRSGRGNPAPCFQGSPFECKDESLPQPFYRLGLDLYNNAPASQPHTIGVDVKRTNTGETAALTGLRAWFSTDEGVTWHETTVTNGNMTIQNPATGYVWLKVEAATATGERVTQTVQRIYSVT